MDLQKHRGLLDDLANVAGEYEYHCRQPMPGKRGDGVPSGGLYRLLELERVIEDHRRRDPRRFEIADELKRIGEQLHQAGGEDLMTRGFYHVVDRHGMNAASPLSRIWDGIGEWRA